MRVLSNFKHLSKPYIRSTPYKGSLHWSDLGVIQSVFKVTENIKLCMFQFKINHKFISTRDKLLRAKIVENDKCQACGSKQTLLHLLVECKYVDRKLFGTPLPLSGILAIRPGCSNGC